MHKAGGARCVFHGAVCHRGVREVGHVLDADVIDASLLFATVLMTKARMTAMCFDA